MKKKILWFTNTPSLYDKCKNGYNGGGWIESLEELIASETEIELAVSFFHPDNCFKIKRSRTSYYPISPKISLTKRILNNIYYSKKDEIEISYFLKVIDDFKPDVIHIFGTEKSFGLLANKTNVPIIIHIQGILNPYLNAYFAPGTSKLDWITHYFLKPLKILNLLRGMSAFAHNTKREAVILKNCKFFAGRTHWDHAVTSIYSSESKYFYCSEVLREVFYNSTPWTILKRDKIIISSTISKTSYKGFDTILKTAKLLKEYTSLNFVWDIYGIDEYREWEKKLNIKCKDNNIYFRGIVDSKSLLEGLLDSDLFIHPSYIDNSPNSVCEAQMIGLPVIATNVGGISSLIENGKTGYLVPANDPYSLVAKICELINNKSKAIQIGQTAREESLKRHNKGKIKADLLDIYESIAK